MKSRILLLIICVFFLITRLYKVSEIPPSVYWDEASLGYNAYSIALDGKDEWGKFLPIHFRAFGEFKLPIYIYSLVPFTKIFGLNSLSVRLPAILFSLISIILTYLIVVKIYQDKKAGLLSSLFLSISPWFFIFSRTGYEVTAGMMFFMLGFYLFLFIEKNKLFLILSTVCFIGSVYSYNTFRLVSPLIFSILLLLQFRKKASARNVIWIFGCLLFFSVSFIPIVRLSLYDAGFVRTQSFRLFPSIQQVYDLKGKPHYQLIYDRSGTLHWDENFSILIKNYLAHLGPGFLLFKGDPNPRHQQVGFGQIYIIDLISMICGIFYIVSAKKKWGSFLYIIVFLAITSAALFKQSPHALRSLLAVPFISILSALGVSNISKRWGIKSAVIIIAINLFLFGNYFYFFITTYSKNNSIHWQYGYEKIYKDYASVFPDYDHIVISDHDAQPYIFALFYQKYDPIKFRSQVARNDIDKWGFSTVKSFDKFLFEKIKIENLPKGKDLVFAPDDEKMNNLSIKGIIYNLDNSVSFYVYEYKK